ncbi:NTP transferase domain-containing protein [Peribacillus frigoritolerans]|nr:NTP transferase domain-containing protein [Peribacillus frigoritolerans]
MEWTMLLLAGGKSSRMGVNKALLTVGGVVNISRVASELKKDVRKHYGHYEYI